MNFPACFKLTEVKTNSQCLHFIRGKKTGQAINRWTRITIWKALIACRKQKIDVRVLLVPSKLQKKYVKTIQLAQKNGGEILSNWLKAPPGNVKVLILLLPSTLPKNCKKKTRENDSVGSENVVEILSNRIIENAEILACKKITWKWFRWPRRMTAKFYQIIENAEILN